MLNGKTVSDPNAMYQYRAYIGTLMNYTKEVQESRLPAEGWAKDTYGDTMDDTSAAAAGTNVGLKTRAALFAKSALVELVGKPHVDLFNQNRLLPPGVDLFMKLVPSSDVFLFKKAAAVVNDVKFVIKKASLHIHMKELSNAAELAHKELLRTRPMKFPHTRVQAKHYTIPANTTKYSIDNMFTGPLPDRVIVGLVSDEDFGGTYSGNPFRFQQFGVTNMELKRNGTPVPRQGYTPDFAKKLYTKDYLLFLNQLKLDRGNWCPPITKEEWADGYTLWPFKVTDGPIGTGTEGPRSRAYEGSFRLEITFAANLGHNIKVVVLSESLGMLEIDEFKNIIVS
jgi:hypothetical protein